MDQVKKQQSLRPYWTYGLPLLGFMSVLAVVGIVATLVLRHFF